MKKVLYSLLAAASILSFTNCKNKTSENPVAPLAKATVSGTVFAELDNTVAGYEKAPAGTKVYVSFNASQLSVNTSDANYPTKTYEGTVDASGKFSIEVDVNVNVPLQVNVKSGDFSATVKTGASTSAVKTFFSNNYNSNVTAGSTGLVEIYTYN